MIRTASTADAPAICAIYNHYVAVSDATFEESPVMVEKMPRRIETTVAAWPWLVSEEDGAITCYAYANPWKSRSGYRHAVESSVYLDPACVGHGTAPRCTRR